jgi:hypothetical protein
MPMLILHTHLQMLATPNVRGGCLPAVTCGSSKIAKRFELGSDPGRPDLG